jgi:hypothetical protein
MSSLRRSLLRRYRLFTPRLWRNCLLLLALLLLCDGILSLWLPQIQAALSLTAPASSQGAGVVTPAVVAMDNEPALASDDFRRANQPYWGISPDGQVWQADAQTARSFAISGGKGIVNATPGFLCGVLGPVVPNAEVRFDASLSHYGPSSLGAILRWVDPGDYYAVVLDGQELRLLRTMDGMETPLYEMQFVARNNSSYTFLFRVMGEQLSAMVWPAGQPAPADWQISFADSALSSGRAGIGFSIRAGTQAQVSNFKEVEL